MRPNRAIVIKSYLSVSLSKKIYYVLELYNGLL